MTSTTTDPAGGRPESDRDPVDLLGQWLKHWLEDFADPTDNQESSPAVDMTMPDGFALIYLLAILRSLNPAVARDAERFLQTFCWTAGDNEMVWWVRRWNGEFAAGRPLTLIEIPGGTDNGS